MPGATFRNQGEGSGRAPGRWVCRREATRTEGAPQALFGNQWGWCVWIMGGGAASWPRAGREPASGREDAPSATEGTVARLRPSIQYRAVAGFPTGFLCFVDARSVLRRACDFSHLPSEERCSGRGKDARRRKAEDVVSLRVPSLTREHRMRQYVGTGMSRAVRGFGAGIVDGAGLFARPRMQTGRKGYDAGAAAAAASRANPGFRFLIRRNTRKDGLGRRPRCPRALLSDPRPDDGKGRKAGPDDRTCVAMGIAVCRGRPLAGGLFAGGCAGRVLARAGLCCGR